jgi:hypothetical protein
MACSRVNFHYWYSAYLGFVRETNAWAALANKIAQIQILVDRNLFQTLIYDMQFILYFPLLLVSNRSKQIKITFCELMVF